MKSRPEHYMRECLRLAAKGRGQVSPNPMVGAVLVRDNQVIARGWHKRFGEAHAEVNCLHNARGDLSRATMYVNLEPCSHTGKTPPCADLIVNSDGWWWRCRIRTRGWRGEGLPGFVARG
jgi:diaminohydroxyphosphoribosylaminopyrimidine deaminase/5-amino-6-(5-phosphoribosylamino)uracil reductase